MASGWSGKQDREEARDGELLSKATSLPASTVI